MLGHNLGCPVGTLPDNLLCGDPSQTEKGVFRVPARKELHMGRNNSMQKPSIMTRLKSDQAVAVGFISPALIVLSCVIAIPILRGIWTSFCDCSLRNLMSPTWAGLKNYIALFKKGEFFTYFFHTLVFVFFTVSIQLILGMGVALLLNSKIRGRAVFRGMMLIPWTIPSVVVALVWRWILQQQYGVINYLLMKVGIIDGMNLSWTMDATLAMISIVAACVWKQLPCMTVMILAGLQSVDSSLLEAACIDGGNPFQRFWHIVLPSIRPVLFTSVWLAITQNFQQFTIINNMTGGGPVDATTTLSIAAYKAAFQSYNFGESAAIGVIWMVFLFVLTFISNKANENHADTL